MEYLSEQEKAVLSLFRLSRDAVCVLREGRVLGANAAARRLLGEEPEGKPLPELLPGLDLRALGEGECVTAADIRGVTRTVTAVQQEGLLILTVLSQEQSAPAASAALLSQLRSAAFRLRFSLDKLLSDRTEEDPYVEILYHSYYSLSHLIGELSDVNALTRGDMALRMQTLDLVPLVRELADSVAFFTAEREIKIACRTPESGCLIRGDREKLQQLLLILLSNSLRHTPQGGHITLGLARSGRQYILSVDDDGQGMSGEELAYAFTVRDSDDPAAAFTGAGMGLRIAHGLARLHGGAVVLQSRKGEGTRVRLTLSAEENLSLRDSDAPPPDRGPELILTELAGVLPHGAYKTKYRE